MDEKRLSAYNLAGWCLLPKAFPDWAIEASLDWLMAASQSAAQEYGMEPQFELSDVANAHSIIVRKLRRLFWHDQPFWKKILESSGVFALASRFIPENLALIRHAAFLKPSQVGSEVAPHQDQVLWEYDYPKAISLWISLSQATQENGCLKLSYGSHLGGKIVHQSDGLYPWHPYIKADNEAIAKLKPLTTEPGDIVIWHRYLVHGSSANLSSANRIGMVLVFADAGLPNFRTKDIFRVV